MSKHSFTATTQNPNNIRKQKASIIRLQRRQNGIVNIIKPIGSTKLVSTLNRKNIYFNVFLNPTFRAFQKNPIPTT
jgi:hypothetical protein